jgi:hypothetical protein
MPHMHSRIRPIWSLPILLVWIVAPLPSVTAQSATTIAASRPAVTIPQGFIVGADISWVQAAEDRGVRYSDGGIDRDILRDPPGSRFQLHPVARLQRSHPAHAA